MMKAGVIEEMMEDTFEAIDDPEELEEDVQQAVDKILSGSNSIHIFSYGVLLTVFSQAIFLRFCETHGRLNTLRAKNITF